MEKHKNIPELRFPEYNINWEKKKIESFIDFLSGYPFDGEDISEDQSDHPRAVVGLTDLSARKAVRTTLGKDVLTFSVPLALYLEMEQNVSGSFLELDLWKELRGSE